VTPNVLMVLCDTARADAFAPWGGRHRSPAMERLCETGITYTQAISAAPWTLPSIASIFSGLLPTEHRITGECIRRVDGRPSSPAPAVRAHRGSWLPEALRDRGFRTWGASCNSWISAWSGFDRGFDEFANLRQRRVVKTGTGRLTRRLREMSVLGREDKGGMAALRLFQRWLRGGHESAPWFAFVNLMEVHTPYDPPIRFHPVFDRAGSRRIRLPRYQIMQGPLRARPSRGYLAAIRSLYAACGRYEDWLVGGFVEAVKQGTGPSVVVVVSDHGENLGEHGLFGHHSSLHETLLHVPLVVAGHRHALGEGRVDRPVSIKGLADWLIGVVDGEDSPMDAHGPVVSEYESTSRHTPTPHELRDRMEEGNGSRLPALVHQPGVAVRDGDRKYVVTEDGRQALHDLDADPGEESNLLGPDAGAGAEMAALIAVVEAWRRRRADTQPIPGGADFAEGEIAEHLRVLGYIE
jgi:arylsulfatase A-like enzyme